MEAAGDPPRRAAASVPVWRGGWQEQGDSGGFRTQDSSRSQPLWVHPLTGFRNSRSAIVKTRRSEPSAADVAKPCYWMERVTEFEERPSAIRITSTSPLPAKLRGKGPR